MKENYCTQVFQKYVPEFWSQAISWHQLIAYYIAERIEKVPKRIESKNIFLIIFFEIFFCRKWPYYLGIINLKKNGAWYDVNNQLKKLDAIVSFKNHYISHSINLNKHSSSTNTLYNRGASLKGNELPLPPPGAFGTPNTIHHNFGQIGLQRNYWRGHHSLLRTFSD